MSCNITLGPINVYDYYTLIKHHKQAPKKKNAVCVQINVYNAYLARLAFPIFYHNS